VLLLMMMLLLVVQTEMEDAVFIWCAEGSTRSHSSSSSSSSKQYQQQQQQSMPAAAAAGATAPVFMLDCLLPLEDTAASLAWLDTAGLPPLLAVGYASGLLELYSRDHRCETMRLFQIIGVCLAVLACIWEGMHSCRRCWRWAMLPGC
jgi:hypothetical protein